MNQTEVVVWPSNLGKDWVVAQLPDYMQKGCIHTGQDRTLPLIGKAVTRRTRGGVCHACFMLGIKGKKATLKGNEKDWKDCQKWEFCLW